MKIPRIIIKSGKEYEYESKINEKLFLYRDVKTGIKEAFSKYDLNLIDNTELDKKISIHKPNNGMKVLVYDKSTEQEKIYDSMKEASTVIGVTQQYLRDLIKENKWIKKRYFVEKVDE